MTEKVVVTGGAGFVGSHIVDGLLDEGYDVHVIDNLIAGKEENINNRAVFHNSDIRNLSELENIFQDAKFVFHLAALPRVQYSIENPEETMSVNISGTHNVLIAAQRKNVSKVVFSSSGAVYGNPEILPLKEKMRERPICPYAMHKQVGEIMCKQWSEVYGLPTVCLRYSNVYGPRIDPDAPYALIVGIFKKQKEQNKPLTITGNGKQTRDFVHVRDVVWANVLAAINENVGSGEVINIGSGKRHSINHLAKLFGGPIEYIDSRSEARHNLADISKAKKLLKWKPEISLEDGIAEILKY